MVINGKTISNLTEEEKVLLEKKFSSFKRLPVESNNVCPNYYNPYHDPRNCPGFLQILSLGRCTDRRRYVENFCRKNRTAKKAAPPPSTARSAI